MNKNFSEKKDILMSQKCQLTFIHFQEINGEFIAKILKQTIESKTGDAEDNESSDTEKGRTQKDKSRFDQDKGWKTKPLVKGIPWEGRTQILKYIEDMIIAKFKKKER